MALTDNKIVAFSKTIAALADKPSLGTTALLKQWFDSSPEELRVAHNNLIDFMSANYQFDSASINVKNYNASGSALTTIGNMTSGSNQLLLANHLDFANGQGISVAGNAEAASLQITAAATVSSNVTVTLNGVAFLVAVLSTDTIAQVATKIRAAVYAGWTAGGAALSDTITFISLTTGVKTDATYSAGTTTAAGTMTTTTQGSADLITSIVSGAGTTTLVLAASATATVTGVTVQHDDTVAIQAAVTYAISIGKTEIKMSYGTYRYGVLTSTSGITFVGDGVTLTGTTALTLTSLAALSAETATKLYNVMTGFGAKGDGVTDDTAAIQAAINAVPSGGGIVLFPNPAVFYKAANLQLKSNITLIGQCSSKNDSTSLGLKGDGVNPVFKTGTYPGGDGNLNRNISIYNLYIENTAVPAIQLYYSNNFTMRDCVVKTTIGNAILGRYSYRLRFENNFISTGGIGSDIENTFAISMMDNCNGLVIEGNTITGGSAGSGVDIGNSQNVAVNHNILESITTGYGIRIAGNSGAYSGTVNGFELRNNYLEQVKKPFSIGEYFLAVGGSVVANFINNGAIAVAGTYCFGLGRCLGVTVSNNQYYKKATEAFIRFSYFAGGEANYFTDGVIEKNYTSENTNNYTWDTTFSAANQALSGLVFGSSRISFMSNPGYTIKSAPTGITKTIVTRTFTANVAVGSTAMIPKTTEGGVLDNIELIDAQGSLGACTLNIGTVTSFSELVAGLSLATLTVDAYGYVNLGAIGNQGLIRRGEPVIINITAGAGAGTFRLRFSYRN